MTEQRDSTSLLAGFCWREDCLGCRSWARDSGFSCMLGRGERNLTQFFPWYSPMVTTGSSAFLKGSGLLPSTSAVGYHSLPRKRLRSHQNCWTTQHLGDRDAIYQLTFAYSGLSWLISPPAHFFCLLLLGNRLLHFSGPAEKKFLAAKLSLTIWSTGQQALAGFQPQDLSDVGIFCWGYSCCLFKYWERCISRVALADNHRKRRGKKASSFLQGLLLSPVEGWRLRSAPGPVPRNNWPLVCLQRFGAHLSSQKGSCCLCFRRPESKMSD